MHGHDFEWGHRQVRLTPDAAVLLHLVQSLGHLEAELVDDFFRELAPDCAALTPEPLELDRPRLRRRLARFLFARQGDLGPEALELLAREWPLLFG
jgi:hypothetical protein